MRCILCGGDHAPNPTICDENGMEREAKRIGAKRWNQISFQAMKRPLKDAIDALRQDNSTSEEQ